MSLLFIPLGCYFLNWMNEVEPRKYYIFLEMQYDTNACESDKNALSSSSFTNNTCIIFYFIFYCLRFVKKMKYIKITLLQNKNVMLHIYFTRQNGIIMNSVYKMGNKIFWWWDFTWEHFKWSEIKFLKLVEAECPNWVNTKKIEDFNSKRYGVEW